MMEKILPFPQKKILSVWSSVPAVCARRHVLWHKFFRKNSPCCLLVRGKSLPLHPLSGREAARRGGAGREEKRGRGEKKVWRFRAKPLPLQPVSPWRGGSPAGWRQPPAGAYKGERSLKELEARDKRRPAALSGRGARPGGPSPGREKLGKVNFYNEEFDPGSG